MKATSPSPVNHTVLVAICFALTLLATVPDARAQGSLTPSGAPAPMYKTLQQVEPRTDVMRLTGDGTASRIISQPGSYYLTTNLVGTPGLHGISIRASNVTLDLNGFALLSLTNTTMDAINVPMPQRDLEIRTGNIEGWGGDGVDSSMGTTDGRYFNLRSYRNSGNGFNLGPRSVVTECQAATNTLNGIQVESGVLKNCIVVGNGYYTNGFPAGGHGIFVFGPVNESDVVKDCVADYNGGDGINVGFVFSGKGTLISDCTTKGNVSDGIEVASGCVVRGNNVVTNGINGIHFTGTGNRIEDNHISFHPTAVFGDPFTIGNLIIKNSAQGNGIGYVVPPGNHLAAITLFPGIGFVGAGPWTNFEF